MNIINCQDLHRRFEKEMKGKATSFCRKGVKCFSNSFIHDCWISSIVGIFTEYLKWRWQEKRQLNFWNGMKCFSNSFVYDTIGVYHQLSKSSSIVWNRDDRKGDTSLCQKRMKCLNDIFINDCCLSSFVRIFTEYLKRRWQEKRHLNLTKGHEVFQ